MRLYLILAAGLSLLVGGEACADTIVLKNGRRIVADSVVVDGDRVRYLTAAGELVLPESIVDHIEKGGVVQMPGSPTAGAANLAMTPPALKPTKANAEAARAAVHDGVVDREFLAAAGTEPRAAAPGANENAAVAPHDAAH